jgi:hypothetical protein
VTFIASICVIMYLWASALECMMVASDASLEAIRTRC